MREDFADLLRRLDRPKTNADLRRAVEALGALAPEVVDDAIAVLRDPEWDRPVDRTGRWGHDPLKVQLWKALLVGAGAAEVDRLWFLADQPDPELRSDFVADAIATGHPELLDRARSLLDDDDQEVREGVAVGLRDAMRATSSAAYVDEAAAILLDYLRAFPRDSDIARMMALQSVGGEVAERAVELFAAASRLDPDAKWCAVRRNDLGWGDYGDILVHGMASDHARNGVGNLRLERTGPFVPPITVPGSGLVVVTAEGRCELEASNLHALEFRGVELARIVKLPWHEWDLDADDPAKYPAGGEPENYILGRKHSSALAASLPELFEVVLPTCEPDVDLPTDLDLVRRGSYQVVASRRAREWLEPRWSRWVEFARLDG